MASLALRPLRATVRPRVVAIGLGSMGGPLAGRVAAAYSTAAAPALRKGTKLLVCDMAGTTVEENGLVYTTLRESMCRAGLSVSEAEMHPWHGAAKEEVVRHFARREAAPGDVKGAAKLERSIVSKFESELREAYLAPGSPLCAALFLGAVQARNCFQADQARPDAAWPRDDGGSRQPYAARSIEFCHPSTWKPPRAPVARASDVSHPSSWGC